MKIFLIGLPGSGKSRLGKELAQALNLPFIDLDGEIEKACNRSVTSLFENEGEEFFRKEEAQTLDRMINDTQAFVMATGGGTPCFYDGIEKMNSAGITLFLDVPVEVISQRMSESEKKIRPLLSATTENVLENLQRLRQNRLPVYQKSKIAVQDSVIIVDEIREKISEYLSKGNSESNLV